jgi:hypothetical protein
MSSFLEAHNVCFSRDTMGYLVHLLLHRGMQELHKGKVFGMGGNECKQRGLPSLNLDMRLLYTLQPSTENYLSEATL